MYKIMVVDDEKFMRELLFYFLTSRGHMCSGASNGIEALEIMNTEKFDAVITDMRMPKMDGVTMIRELSKRQFSNPVMVMTGGGIVGNREEAFQAGAQGYIDKPFSLQEFADEFHRMMHDHSL